VRITDREEKEKERVRVLLGTLDSSLRFSRDHVVHD